jgi:hypothetical protein
LNGDQPVSVRDLDENPTLIADALEMLTNTLRCPPTYFNVHASASEGSGGVTRLVVSRGRARVQIGTHAGDAWHGASSP